MLAMRMAKPDPQAHIWKVARVMHESVGAWHRENVQAEARPWSRAPQWMKDSSRDAVLCRIKNPKAKASGQHDQWLESKKKDGWKFGKVKDGVKKTHPMM